MMRWIFAVMGLVLLQPTGIALAQESAGAVPCRVLAEAGDVSSPPAAQATLDALAAALVEQGGGWILIDGRVCREFKPHNPYQAGRDMPGVTIVDVRDGSLTLAVPPVGHDSREVWSDLRVRRTLDLGGGSLPHWGTQAAMHIENNIVQGSYSFMQFLLADVRAGNDAHLELQAVEGLAAGASLMLQGGDPQARDEVIRVKSLGWDAEKRRYYVVADLKHDHPAGAMLQNKHNVPGLALHNHSNADNQTFWLDGRTYQYGVGDQFVVSATHTYQGNVFSGLGDEGAVCLNAEVIHDLDPFRAEVESFDPATGRLVYKPGNTRSQKLALSRPLVNLNPQKWITAGHVLIVRRGYSFRGKEYPDAPGQIGQETIYVRGGAILGSADAPWDESVVGRYFAVDEETERYNPGELPGGYWPYAQGHVIRRWYRITGFQQNDDGTKAIRILRVAWYTMSAGGPDLFREENYTTDGHERPLRYIIAPGAALAEIREGWIDTRRPGIDGLSLASDRRRLTLVPIGDRETRYDFAPGDPIEQAVGPDPWVPKPLRIRMFDEFPSCLENPAIEIANNGSVGRQSGISLHGGPRDLAELAARKDQQPPYINGITFHSAVGCGVRFVGQVRDAALLMEQRGGNAQPLAWRHARGTTYLGADPASGNITVRGGSLDLAESALSGARLVQTRGISASEVPAHNLRGIDVPLAAGSRSAEIHFDQPEPDGQYSLCVQPNWLTAAAVREKRADGFRVEFAAPVPADGRIDWQLIR